jgi:hypothetical protein
VQLLHHKTRETGGKVAKFHDAFFAVLCFHSTAATLLKSVSFFKEEKSMKKHKHVFYGGRKKNERNYVTLFL